MLSQDDVIKHSIDIEKVGNFITHVCEYTVVSLSLRDGMAWPSNQLVSYPLTPTMATEMTVRVRTTAELLGYRVSATVLDKLADMKHLFPDSGFVHHVN